MDILYEVRNITGWTASHAGDWWEDLPDFGEHTWQQRATRRKGQAVLQIAFIPSKFRGGIDPEPFVLAIDTTQDPWTLDDITEDIATAGCEAAEETARLDRAKLEAAERALVHALQTRPPGKPMLKKEAETLLCSQGFRRKGRPYLSSQRRQSQSTPPGRWVLRAILGERGHPIGVYLCGEEDDNRNNCRRDRMIPLLMRHVTCRFRLMALRLTTEIRPSLHQGKLREKPLLYFGWSLATMQPKSAALRTAILLVLRRG